MQAGAAAAREKALKDIEPYLLYADRLALGEGRIAEVAARVSKRLRRQRVHHAFSLGFMVILGLWQILWPDPRFGWNAMALGVALLALAAAFACLLLPWQARSIARIERTLVHGQPIPDAPSERPS